MTHEAKHKLKVALTTALVVGATAIAGNVSVPWAFVANTPARAAEVNANFAAVKQAVDDNHARLQGLEATVPTLQTTVGQLNARVDGLDTTTWKRNGNLNTNPANDWLGTADNAPLDLRVNATSVLRLRPGQVSVNTTTPPTDVELSVIGTSGSGSYANLFLRQSASNVGGFLLSVGGAVATGQPNSTLGRASFFIDGYEPGVRQERRLAIDDLGRMALNRDDSFISGVGVVPLAVGRDGSTGNGAYLTNGGVWTNASSRSFKHSLREVDPEQILEKVAALPITTWEYRGSNEGRHLGPMAEDFASAFGLGRDAQHITTVDESGVALAAIQGLNARLERENAALRSSLDALERRFAVLERQGASPK